jgi:hypothetical protein
LPNRWRKSVIVRSARRSLTTSKLACGAKIRRITQRRSVVFMTRSTKSTETTKISSENRWMKSKLRLERK